MTEKELCLIAIEGIDEKIAKDMQAKNIFVSRYNAIVAEEREMALKQQEATKNQQETAQKDEVVSKKEKPTTK